MSKATRYATLCAILIILPALSFAAPDMQPGKWEITFDPGDARNGFYHAAFQAHPVHHR